VDPTRGASGTAVWNWDLQGEAFGTTVPNQNPDGDANQFVFNMRFPGQRFDSVSGMNYNYFRDYDPSTGRYTQSDPIGLAGGMSTYGYVGGNPLTRIDPNGLLQWTVLPTDVRNNAETGTRVSLYTGATAQTVFRENTLALTSINWGIGGQCTCGDDGNYSLNEFNVSFTPQVTLRRRYSSSRVSTAVRRNEQDHVNDFSAWANGARTNAEALETEFKSRRFSSEADCKNSAQDAMQQYLYDDILPALIESHRRWDVGNPPRHFVPN
jgi:RHS repeat-associated protein